MSVPSKAVYVFVFPGFADWEPAHALAELRRHGGYRVETVARDRNPVMSMGGLSILPSLTLAEVDIDDVAVLILPGGERWEREPMDKHLTVLIRQLERQATPIAAICAATTALVRAKVIQDRRHTSNGLSYLQDQVPEYNANGSYVDAPAVRDRGVITASGLGDVEFAREILAELRVLGEADLEEWSTIFRSGRLPAEGAMRPEVDV